MQKFSSELHQQDMHHTWRCITLSRKKVSLLPTQAAGPGEEMESLGEALSGAVWDDGRSWSEGLWG